MALFWTCGSCTQKQSLHYGTPVLENLICGTELNEGVKILGKIEGFAFFNNWNKLDPHIDRSWINVNYVMIQEREEFMTSLLIRKMG